MVRFSGVADKAARFFEKEQLCDEKMWKRFSEQFRVRLDGKKRGWRGEYWGKTMRGGALVYAYTKSEKLYEILTSSVRDMLTVTGSDGRVSSYEKETEFTGWDIWCRKYVMLGCEYYLDICNDAELKKEVTEFICRIADGIMASVGPEEGKKPITRASNSWLGINSSSVLEPFVRLYELTKKQKYLDYASYIVKCGGADGIDVFELAYKNGIPPYKYGVSKAYELISCFEGLLRYHTVTGIEKYKTAVVNFARAVLDTEISVIGSCGVTHELFDHTGTRQTVFYNGVSQETCVTVTWMKFCSEVLKLTDDPVFADAIEKSFYNAYLGALNVCGKEVKPKSSLFSESEIVGTFLPADSYSPLLPGKRGRLVGGGQILHDKSYYGCCASISPAGVGVFLQNAIVQNNNTVTVNFFERGTAEFEINGTKAVLDIDTGYPSDGKIKIGIKTGSPTRFILRIRRPGWAGGGYYSYDRVWDKDSVELDLPMKVEKRYPEKWDSDVIYTDRAVTDWGCAYAVPVKVTHSDSDDCYVSLSRGPLTLAADGRTGKAPDSAFDFASGGVEREKEIVPGSPCMVDLEFEGKNGEKFRLVDYASAGRDWETPISAWLPTTGKKNG